MTYFTFLAPSAHLPAPQRGPSEYYNEEEAYYDELEFAFLPLFIYFSLDFAPYTTSFLLIFHSY